MKFSDILFEKACVTLYIQEHCTVCKMLRVERRDLDRQRAEERGDKQVDEKECNSENGRI